MEDGTDTEIGVSTELSIYAQNSLSLSLYIYIYIKSVGVEVAMGRRSGDGVFTFMQPAGARFLL